MVRSASGDERETARIGVDIGGTKILVGLVSEDGRVLESVKGPTPTTPGEPLADAVAELVGRLSGIPEASAIGVAMAGRIDVAGRVVVQSANLGLTDAPLAEWIEQRLDRPCILVNDANAALWGEVKHGAARGLDDVVMITVGTGVGGSAIVDGRLLTGAHGLGSEAGHMTVKLDGRQCGCGGRGCLDVYGSGRALGRYARSRHRELAADTPFPSDISAAALAAEPFAVAAFNDLAFWLGIGIANIVAMLDPAQVILSGGVASTGAVLADPVREQLHRELKRRGVPSQPGVATGILGEGAGVVGAASTARELGQPG